MKNLKLAILFGALLPGMAMAHTPLCSCYDLGDNIILCEGGFSDGSSAAGVEMSVKDTSGKVLINSELNEDAEFEFEKPAVAYTVLFDAGPGHAIEIDGKDIVE